MPTEFSGGYRVPVTSEESPAGPDADTRVRLARSFGAAAEDYARHRPGYPAAALEWALEPVRDRRVLRVLDLGAGTGILTRALLRLNVNVIAVEPDPAMRAELVRHTVGAAALSGSAEAIPLPDNRVDAVLIGEAFHWFDAARALGEIARVLNAGGVVAALWHRADDRVGWVAALHDFMEEGATYRHIGVPLDLPPHPRFGPSVHAEFPHGHRRTAESLVEMFSTHSGALMLDSSTREDWQRRTLDHLRTAPEVPKDEFDFPLITVAVRAQRT